MKKKYKKHKGITGYTLHNKRLVYTGNPSIRSVKLPLLYNGDSQIIQNFYESMIHDYEKLNGAINISTFIKDKNIYSLIDFWLDSLRLGVIFGSSFKSLQGTINEIFGTRGPYDEILSKIPQEFRNEINFDIFVKEILQKQGMRSTSSKNSFIKKLKRSFGIDENSPDDQIPTQKKFVMDKINKIADRMFPVDNNYKVVDIQTQRLIWKEELNIEFSDSDKSDYKPTFYIIPSLVDKNTKDFSKISPIEVLNKLRNFVKETWNYSENDEKEITSQVKSLAGLSENFNAFSNYFNNIFNLLFDGNIEAVKDNLNAVFELEKAWGDNIADLDERLNYLANQAQKLGKPKMQNNWDTYRSTFGGKLQSWFSNLLNQENEIRNQLEKHKKEIEVAIKFIEKHDENSPILQDLDQLKRIVQETINSGNIFEAETKINLYRQLLAKFRSDFNQFYQRHNKDDDDNKDLKINKAYPNLFKNLRVTPEFFGGSKYKEYSKYVDKTFDIITQGINMVLQIEESLINKIDKKNLEIEKEYFCKQLQSLKNKITTESLLDKDIRIEVESIIKKYYESKDKLPDKFEAFYISPYSRDKRLKLIPISDDLNFASQLLDIHTGLNKFDVTKFGLDFKKYLSYIEILKIRFGWILKMSQNPTIDVSDLKYDLSNFENAQTYVDYFGSKIEDIGKFVNSFIFSEIKGAISKATRKEFVERYVIQFMDSEQRGLKLTYVPKIINSKPVSLPKTVSLPSNADELLQDPKNDKLFFYPHRWKVLFDFASIKTESTENKPNALVFTSKNDFKNPKKVYVDDENSFDITTSKYQIHFLDRLLYQTKKWRQTKVEFSSPFLILEVTSKVTWDSQTKKPILKPKSNSAKQGVRLFINYPINLKTLPKSKENKQSNIYLGIDTGEYGLAWVAVDFSERLAPKILDKGFIYDDSLRKIQDRVDEIKDAQVKGTFGIPSTKLARIRQHTITTLRNKVHDLLLKYNAKVIYEYSISNFETGSNRVAKIYRSIKVSDVYAETEADKLVKKLVWGNANLLLGNHISAYATSYTCSKCRRSIYFEKGDKNIVEEKQGSLIKVKINENLYVWGYSADKNIHKGSIINSRELINIVKKYARPPQNSEALKKFNIQAEQFYENRGASAIFICPYDDCNHLSDADIQAALNIAIKGYVSDQIGKKNTEKDDDKKLKFYLEYLDEIKEKHPVISLEDVTENRGDRT
ncbi:MAG: hypothetical protein KatS3mg085_230 [Candidatus Dojkabacteria bacterium]|nr:MAG: hypothetical protein KatS3mg085_230 [Candidatus Dojkabacteria bacterium]